MKRSIRIGSRLALLWLVTAAGAQTYTPGQTYYGRNNYIEYQAGNLPVILCAGHGGSLTPAEIPDRASGTTVTDTNTQELTRAIAAEITARTGRYPHVILSRLARIKLDPNREIVEAAAGNAHAEQAWTEYHGYIQAARAAADGSFAFGYLIDLHGHGHEIQRLELGYGLTSATVDLSDRILNRPGYGYKSYYRTLVHQRPGVPFSGMLRGSRSFGGLLALRDIPSWPSPAYPTIDGSPYFPGGYTTANHTCLNDNGVIHGLQIESNFTGIRNTAANRAGFAIALCQVLQPFLYENYGYSLGTNPLYGIRASAPYAGEGETVTLTVDRAGYRSLSSTIGISPGGTAVQGVDYVLGKTSFSFASGAASSATTITFLNDSVAEGDETLEISLAPTDIQCASPVPAAVVITDRDAPVIRVSADDGETEETAGVTTFRVRRTRDTGAITVPLSWSGSAVPGRHHEIPPAFLTEAAFAAGQLEVAIPVALRDDGSFEAARTLTLAAGTVAGYLPGIAPAATCTLRDDDRPQALAIWLPGETSGNLLPDASGHDRHATTLPADDGVSGGPIQEIGSGGRPAIRFDGVDDTVALPKFAADSSGGFSVSFSFQLRAGSVAGNQRLLSYGEEGAAGSLCVFLTPAGVLRTDLRDAARSQAAAELDVPGSWMDDKWHHYVLTADSVNGRRIYVDGVQRIARAGWPGSLDPAEIFWLGWQREELGSSAFMDGSLQDFRVYQRALPAAEVVALATGRASYASWRSAHGLGPAPAEDMDSDEDGMKDLLEYALDSGPTRATAPAPVIERHGNRARLRFHRNLSAGDVALRVEGADSPGAQWTIQATLAPGASGWQAAPGAAVEDNNGKVTFTDAFDVTAGHPRFLRLRAVLPQ